MTKEERDRIAGAIKDWDSLENKRKTVEDKLSKIKCHLGVTQIVISSPRFDRIDIPNEYQRELHDIIKSFLECKLDAIVKRQESI